MFDNDTSKVKTRKRFWFFGETYYRVEILETAASHGEIKYGFAKKALDGYIIYCDDFILSCFGVDGKFPNGCFYRWERWDFMR